MAKIVIKKENYFHNLSLLSEKTGSVDKLMVVIKDNAYGHGLEIIAALAHDFGIKKAAVKTLSEALHVKYFFDEVLILADHPPLRVLTEENISFAVHSLEFLKTFPKNSNIHLNIDTGMHRNGIVMDEIDEALDYISKNSINLKGIFTHFRSADDLNSELFWQQDIWQKIKDTVRREIKNYDIKVPLFHSCNSSALLRSTGLGDDDFARCGIATYGYTHIDKTIGTYDLKPVMALYANRLSSRELKKGQRVGYGGVYECERDMTVSTYDIGYGDGFFRYNGMGDLKTADGQKILGRISMDSMALEGSKDRVLLFSDASNLAKHFNTITYEIITKLMPYIKREVI